MNSEDGGSGRRACASCKHQRRRCHADCPLAPYFPPDEERQFLKAHKLFGISNILKILKNIKATQRADAMKTIIFQAEMRSQDPVRGCLGVTESLKYQIEWTRAELEVTLAYLHSIKSQLQIIHGEDVDTRLDGSPVSSFSTHQRHGVPVAPPQEKMGNEAVEHVCLNMVGLDIRSPPTDASTRVPRTQLQKGESSSSKPVPQSFATAAGIQDEEFKSLIDMLDDHRRLLDPQQQFECRHPGLDILTRRKNIQPSLDSHATRMKSLQGNTSDNSLFLGVE